MESYLSYNDYDLVTPDGRITSIQQIDSRRWIANIKIEKIFPNFVGYDIASELVFFNIKSTLAQIGVEGVKNECSFDRKNQIAEVKVHLSAYGNLALTMLKLLPVGAFLGKLFAGDDRRLVRDPNYLLRMSTRFDRKGNSLLSLGDPDKNQDLILKKTEGRTIAFLPLRSGVFTYESTIEGFLPTLAKALRQNLPYTRQLLNLHRIWNEGASRSTASNEEILLLRTAPLHIRTVYARVINTLLPEGYHHTSANILQPDTSDSGDIYELYGSSKDPLNVIPLEFYTLEPHREHVFFSDRDQLTAYLEDPESLFRAFATAPQSDNLLASTFVVKGTQMRSLHEKDWITRIPVKYNFPGLARPSEQAFIVEKYVENQPQYPFLKAIENEHITSQGVLFSRHFPTPFLKKMLLNHIIANCLKRIYFQYPSFSHDIFFSHEDRALLVDLAKFGIPTFWVNPNKKTLLQFVPRPEKDAGLFVPISLTDDFQKSTVLGVYGSNLKESPFEQELYALINGLLAMRKKVSHSLLNPNTTLSLVTGGGPGAMKIGNRVAKETGIISCANIVDLRVKDQVVNEQETNPYIDAFMTYRLDRLVERQAEFYLDLPIFFPGGIGMDFEYSLEEVRRKTGSDPANPVLLFGDVNYWRGKISSRFQMNKATGMISGSEWVSNCFYCIQTATQGLCVYQKFFENKLPIGKNSPIFEDGFCSVT